MSTNNFIHIAPWLVLAAAILGLCFAAYKFFWVKARPEGTAQMAQIAAKIRKGAMAYLKRQYKTVAIFFVCMLVILCIMASLNMLTWFVPWPFRLYRHEDCDLCQLQNSQRRARWIKQGS